MNAYEINDIRTDKDFVGISFSGFKKTHVKKELTQCLMKSAIEPACNWCAELVASGHFIDVWDIIIIFVSRHIHLGCPKLPLYISIRIESFKSIISTGYVGNELNLRNNTTIRRLFAEIIATLCCAQKRHSFDAIKIKKKEEFSLEIMTEKLKAPNVSFGTVAFKDDDPKEIFIAINEFSYHLSKNNVNEYSACYWLEWLLEFDIVCKRKKSPIKAVRRNTNIIEPNNQTDCIWIIWDIIKYYAKEKDCVATIKIIDALFDMYCLKFSAGTKTRRKYIIYNCISLLTEVVDLTIPIWKDKLQISDIVDKIMVVYKEIKKNEQSPKKNYLLNGTDRSNLDKTRERIEIINKILN